MGRKTLDFVGQKRQRWIGATMIRMDVHQRKLSDANERLHDKDERP